jgi:hypothetical protein
MTIERPIKAPLALAVGITLQAFGTTSAMAAWEFIPDVGLATQINDNPRRLAATPEDVSGRQVLDARARLVSYGPRATAFVEPRIVTDAYTEARDDELQNDDLFLLGEVDYRFQSAQLGARADFRRQSVLRSEIGAALPDDLGIPDVIDTGAGTRGTLTDQREHLDFGINANFTVSQQTDLRLEANRIDVGYRETEVTRTDFDNTALMATLSRRVDERNRIAASMYFSQFSAVDNDNVTDAFGIQARLDRPLTQAWDLSIDAGLVRTDYRFINSSGTLIENAANSFVLAAGLARRAEATLWAVDFGRDISPNANGFLAQRDNFMFRVRHRFSERMTGSAGFRAARFKTAAEATPSDGRDYLRATLELEWYMTPRWRLTGGFDRIVERINSSGREANTNIVSIGLRYRAIRQSSRQSARKPAGRDWHSVTSRWGPVSRRLLLPLRARWPRRQRQLPTERNPIGSPRLAAGAASTFSCSCDFSHC